MTLQERADESMRKIRDPKWWIAVVISVIIVECAWEGYKSWCHAQQEKFEQAENDRKLKELERELDKSLKKGYDFSEGQTSDVKPGFPEWSSCNGDKKACRELLLKNIDIVNNDSKYRNWAYIIHPKIEGNTLWLYSMHFKESYIREDVAESMKQQFKDCGFNSVKMALNRQSGQAFWEVYTEE